MRGLYRKGNLNDHKSKFLTHQITLEYDRYAIGNAEILTDAFLHRVSKE